MHHMKDEWEQMLFTHALIYLRWESKRYFSSRTQHKINRLTLTT